MKTAGTILIALLISISCFAQQGINYKAILKDTNGNVIVAPFMNVDFTIHSTSDTGPIIYNETHPGVSTNANGLLILTIGTAANPSIGVFNDIDWAADQHFLQTTIAYDGGTINFDATEFMAVPYAFHALTSGDKSWESEVDNVHILSKNVGIGTNTPTALLEINDPDLAGIKLAVPSYNNTSQIEFKNGPETGAHTFYKIENSNDALRFEIDTDITGPTGFEQKMTLSNAGLALQSGSSINEFSTDATLAGNSNTAVPTEQAVKDYVDAAAAAAGPLAYGSIAADGTINSGSGNYTVIWSSLFNWYTITITGETLNIQNSTTVVTPTSSQGVTYRTGSISGSLLVIFEDAAGELTQGSFHFITYK